MQDIERYRIGTLVSLIITKVNLNEQAQAEAEKESKKGRKATQADIDAFARR
jgi:hypothetical protein